MISSLREVREELAAAIGDVVPTHSVLPASPEPPFAVVMWPQEIDLSRTLAGHSQISIAITVYVGMTDIEAGQKQLDDFISGSISSSIQDHSTDAWRNVIVESVTNIRPEDVGEAKCLAADFNLTLIA